MHRTLLIVAMLVGLAIPGLVAADETVIPPRRTGRPRHRRGQPWMSGRWRSCWWRKG
jgi:hypothetical protein